MKTFALEELLKIACQDLEKYALTQPIVCHGLIGTAAIMSMMYIETGRHEFINKAIEMTKLCASLDATSFIDADKKRSETLNLHPRATLHDYLEGYAGILQTILSIIEGIPNENEMRLLIV